MSPKSTDSPAENLDKQINAHLASMSTLDPKESPEYATMVAHLETLYSLRNASAPKPMSTGEKATIAANIAGILLVLNHERLGVITSKAFSIITKLR